MDQIAVCRYRGQLHDTVCSSGVAALESTHHCPGKAWRVETETAELAGRDPLIDGSEIHPTSTSSTYLGEKGPIAID